MTKKKKKILKTAGFYLCIALLLLVVLIPFFFMAAVSLKTTSEAIQTPPTLWPAKITLQHYQDIFNANIFPFHAYFKNSLYVSLLSASTSLLFGILGG